MALASLGLVGCAAQLRQQDRDLYAARTKDEKDPDMKAWLKGLDDCRVAIYDNGSTLPVDHFDHCTPKVEREIVAKMKAQAAAETNPEAKAARERAISCFEKAPAVIGRSRSNEGKDYDVVKKCFDERASVLASAKATDDAETGTRNAYAAAEKANTVDAYMSFITAHPNDARASTAAKRVAALSASASGDAQAAIDEKLVAAFPAAAKELPPERRVPLIGPAGLRVRDVRKMTEAKIAPKIIVARINASSEPFKSFDADELVVLKNMGLSDDVVAAMMEVTTKVEERRRADQEREAMRAEIAALKAMIEKQAAAGAAKSGQTVQTKEGPMDVMASCAKRLGALKACEEIPSIGAAICSSAAESAFPCPNK